MSGIKFILQAKSLCTWRLYSFLFPHDLRLLLSTTAATLDQLQTYSVPSSVRFAPDPNFSLDVGKDRKAYRLPGRASAGLRTMRMSTFPSRNDFQNTYSKVKLPFSWPPWIPTIIPHRIRRKLRSKVRSRQSSSSSFTTLQTSYSPADTLNSLRAHRWSFYDGQYLILIILGIFSLSIIPSPGPFVKTALATLIITALILPVTRQFLLPSLAIWSWLVFFYACG